MAEDSPDGAREHDGGHEPQAATAVRALEHIDAEAADPMTKSPQSPTPRQTEVSPMCPV
jgi:hypothetical protein